MLSIASAVENIVRQDRTACEALRRGVMNLSQYAREIQKVVSDETKKDVGIQSIVVTLSRLEKVLAKSRVSREIDIQQLSVQSPIVQLIYPKNSETTSELVAAINKANGLADVFFSISTSTKDIGLIVSEKILNNVKSTFTLRPLVEKHGLSAVSIRFDERLVREANVGLVLLEKIASHDVVLDAALTTFNEFTLVFEGKYLEKVISALQPN